MITILVTGGRDYADAAFVDLVLDAMKMRFGAFRLVHGAASGADSLAHAWGIENLGLKNVIPVPADWKRFGNKAGPIRNGAMIRVLKPTCGVAFPGGDGTDDCVRQMRAAGVPVYDFRKKGKLP